MNAEKRKYVCEVLDQYFPDPPVPLNSVNDFTFLVAVVLSAQTTDGKVNEVTRRLFSEASNPEAMSTLSSTYVETIIKPVGLAPTKARNIVALSKMLVDKFGGELPKTLEELETLPGVGRKTASVVLAQTFGVPAFPVDTHIHRLALRWGISRDGKNVLNVQRDLCDTFPETSWNKLHLQMIYFGREFCYAKNHEPANCPICSWIKKPGGRPPSSFEHFQSQKPAKGIVYYQQRVHELAGNPGLAPNSPPPASVSPTAVAETRAVEVSVVTSYSAIEVDVATEFDPEKFITPVKRKPNRSPMITAGGDASIASSRQRRQKIQRTDFSDTIL